MRHIAAPIVVIVVFFAQLLAQNEPRAGQYGIAYASFAPLTARCSSPTPTAATSTPLSPDPGWDANASFSMDRQWVVFTSNRQGSADIYRVHPDGRGLERLTDDPAFDDQAALSPDGRQLAFVSTRTGRAEIWLLDLDDEGAEEPDGEIGRKLPARLVA